MKRFFQSSAAVLIAILSIAAFLRFYKIAELPPGFYPDEAMYANNGVEAWETGNFKVFYPENAGREGLWPNIIGFFAVKFGRQPWIPRAAAAVFGTLTVPGMYFLAKELFDRNLGFETRNAEQRQNQNNNYNQNLKRNEKSGISRGEKIALLASFFLAVSFWHVNFSRIAFRAIMAPFFSVWGIYFLLSFLNRIVDDSDIEEKNKNQISKIKNTEQKLKIILFSIFGGIFYGLGFHSYIAYRATPLLVFAILLFYWLKNRDRTVRKKILLFTFYFLLLTFVVVAPLGVYFLKNPQDFFGRTSQISVFNSLTPFRDFAVNVVKTLGMFNFYGDKNWRHNIAGRPLLFWPTGILFLMGVFLAVKNLIESVKSKIKNDNVKFQNDADNAPPRTKTKILRFDFCILIFWLVVAVLPVVISNEGLPHALRAILTVPPVFILAAAGGVWLYEFILGKLRNAAETENSIKIFNVFVLVFLSLLFFEAYNAYFIKWGRNPNVAGAFNRNYAEIGRRLNGLPKETAKYVVVKAGGFLVNGVPMPAQTVMFITDTYTPEKQKAKNIFYILPEQAERIPSRSYIAVLE